MLQNLIWLDDSIHSRDAIGMQSAESIQLPAQNRLSSPPLRLPDLATTLHNRLNYSRLEEEADSLTSALLHVKQALYRPISCTQPKSPPQSFPANDIWVDSEFS